MFSSATIGRTPHVIREIGSPAVTTIRSAISVARLGVGALLVGAGMLIGSVQPGQAGEITVTPVSVERPAPDARRLDAPATSAPAQPADATQSQFFGAVGFGWG